MIEIWELRIWKHKNEKLCYAAQLFNRRDMCGNLSHNMYFKKIWRCFIFKDEQNYVNCKPPMAGKTFMCHWPWWNMFTSKLNMYTEEALHVHSRIGYIIHMTDVFPFPLNLIWVTQTFDITHIFTHKRFLSAQQKICSKMYLSCKFTPQI